MAGVTVAATSVAAAGLRFEQLSELVADSVSLGGLAMLSSGREGGLTRDVIIAITSFTWVRVRRRYTETFNFYFGRSLFAFTLVMPYNGS